MSVSKKKNIPLLKIVEHCSWAICIWFRNSIFIFVLLIGISRSYDNDLRWMSYDLNDDLVDVRCVLEAPLTFIFRYCWYDVSICDWSVFWNNEESFLETLYPFVSHYPHYIDVIMTTVASQIKENIKAPRHWPLCGEFTGTGEFPTQRASNAENGSTWWRHHECSRWQTSQRCLIVV